jgi:hypothetical protein
MRVCATLLIAIMIILQLNSCDDDVPLKKGDVEFSVKNLALGEYGSSRQIFVLLSKPAVKNEEIVITLEDSTSLYGKEYVTSPAGTSGSIILAIPKGSTSADFTITPLLNSSTDGTKFLNLTITGTSERLNLPSEKLKITVLDDDLVCYLPFNGNVNDESRFAHTSTAHGPSLVANRNNLSNSAYSFNGTSNDITVNNSTALDTLYQITMAAWVKPVSFTGGNYAILEKPAPSHTDPYYQYKLGITGNLHLNLPASFIMSLSLNGSYTYLTSASPVWTPGNWYFVVGTYNGRMMKLYINGTLVASKNVTGTITSFGRSLYIAKAINPNLYTPGTIDDLRIYNRALTNAEILSLYSR